MEISPSQNIRRKMRKVKSTWKFGPLLASLNGLHRRNGLNSHRNGLNSHRNHGLNSHRNGRRGLCRVPITNQVGAAVATDTTLLLQNVLFSLIPMQIETWAFGIIGQRGNTSECEMHLVPMQPGPNADRTMVKWS